MISAIRLTTLMARLSLSLAAGWIASPLLAQGTGSDGALPVLTVNTRQPGLPLNPTQYGVFFEELNHAGEGGLYAELISNRSFEDEVGGIPNWTLQPRNVTGAGISLISSNLLNSAQSQALRFQVPAGTSPALVNDGYWGINIVKGRTYKLSLFARSDLPSSATLTVSLQNAEGTKTFATCVLRRLSGGWTRYTASLTATGTQPQGRLALRVTTPQAGMLDLDVVSLFPPTWKNRPNGARPDLAEMIAYMKPGVIRFPGGSYVSTKPAEAPRPLTELGPIEGRPGHPNPGKKNPWGYHDNDGWGFHEYLQFAEDLGAEPIYVFQGGADPQSNTNNPELFIQGPALDKLIEETLCAIEYANGPATGVWGARRAANGHPAPFKMKYVQVGNENWHRPFHDNYKKIYQAIKARYPELQVIWGGDWIGNNEHGYRSDGLMPEGSAAEIIDEHYYKGDDFFFTNPNRFSPEFYPRNHPRAAKIFLGEVSAVADTLEGALKETAFLLGAERYPDKVVMAVYAPLLCHVATKTWPANAIYLDNARAYGTPSYHAQAMLGRNQGGVNLPMSGLEGLRDYTVYINATRVEPGGEVILKMVNREARAQHFQVELSGLAASARAAREIVLTGPSPAAGNSFTNATLVAPVERRLGRLKNPWVQTLPPHSFTIVRFRP